MTSFCVNPLLDTAIDMHQMERVNRGINDKNDNEDHGDDDDDDDDSNITIT